MSNVNDNNLDDLLRRAAERYPLRTDSADWDRMAADLEKDPSLILPPVTAEEGRRRRRFFWLFLLLPLAGVGYYTWQATGRSTGIGGKATPATQKETPGAVREDAAAKPDGSVAKSNDPASRSDLATVKPNDPAGSGFTPAKPNGPAASSNPDAVKKTGPEGRSGVATAKSNDPEGRSDLATVKPNSPAGSGLTPAKPNGPAARSNFAAASYKDTKVRSHVAGRPGSNDPSTDMNSAPAPSNGTSLTAQPTPVAAKDLHHADLKLQPASTKGNAIVNIPVRSNTTTLIKPTKKDKIKLQIPKHSFYVGILGSPDLSSVKFQSVKNTGSSYGLLLGYSLNSHWSLETGLSYDTKKYYTDGEYFSKKINRSLEYIKDLKVNGVCNMWEIPINVRYNFSSPSGKTKWFATAGVSSYLMSREKYDCTGYAYGNPYDKEWDHSVSYRTLFSVVNLSAGFEQRIGKIGNLRLEPYLRIPMSGIGTGNLSIMSAGLNIGITRRIW